METNVERPDWGTMEKVPVVKGPEVHQVWVNQGERMPLRSNSGQCEQWLVLEGIGRAQIDHKNSLVAKGACLFVPADADFSVKNIGNVPLRLMAVHYGAEWPTSNEPFEAARRAVRNYAG